MIEAGRNPKKTTWHGKHVMCTATRIFIGRKKHQHPMKFSFIFSDGGVFIIYWKLQLVGNSSIVNNT